MMDKIILNDMIFYGYHGVLPEENQLGQKFRVDMELLLNLSPAARTDMLDMTISYADVFALCKEITEGRAKPCKLLEALADQLVEAVLDEYPQVAACKVSVTKENPPIAGHFGSAAVEIKRLRRAHLAFLSLGTNIGDREGFLQLAISGLNVEQEIRILKASSIYETKPVGLEEQADFLNMVLVVETSLTPSKLLQQCQEIEAIIGRERTVRWGPRTIDIDILLYDNEIIESENLIIPHPRMHERAFVLVPLVEVALNEIWPIDGRPIEEMLAALPKQEVASVKKFSEGL